MTPEQPMSASVPPRFIPVPPLQAAYPPGPPSPPSVQKQSGLMSVLWVLAGAAGTCVGAAIAAMLTLAAVPPNSNDSVASLGAFLTAPLGAIAGVVVAIALAVVARRRWPGPNRKAIRLVMWGALVPFVFVAGLGLLLIWTMLTL